MKLSYILSIFIYLLSEISGAEPFTVANLNRNLGSIVDINNNDAPKVQNITRAKASFKFKQFIESSRETTGQKAVQAIARLRGILSPLLPVVQGTYINNIIQSLLTDLSEDPTNFLTRRLLRSEIEIQPNKDAILNPTEMNTLVGTININGYSVSGTLIALPPHAVGGVPTFYVLTCAHTLNGIPKTDDNMPIPASFSLNNFLGGIYHSIPIKFIKVFKKPNRDAKITNLPKPQHNIPLQKNTADINDMRAVPLYNKEGDVALLELDISAPTYNFFRNHINIQNVNLANDPADQHQIIRFNMGNVTYNFHFINTHNQANTLVNSANAHNNNIILGYPAIGTGTLHRTEKRNYHPLFVGNFINPANFTKFQFFHDAPQYWGMSGGPIFYTDHNIHTNHTTVHVYGVVYDLNGYDAANPNWSSQCIGSFLQDGLL